MKMKNPKIIEVKEIESEMMKNFYKESKRVKNRKMKKLLKIKLKFPTFKDGLRNLKNQSI